MLAGYAHRRLLPIGLEAWPIGHGVRADRRCRRRTPIVDDVAVLDEWTPRLQQFLAEMRRIRRSVREAPARVLIGESVCFAIVLALGVLTRPPVVAPLTGLLVTCYAAALVSARRRWPIGTLLASSLVLSSPHQIVAIPLAVIAFSAGRRASRVRRLWGAVALSAAVHVTLVLITHSSVPAPLGEQLAHSPADFAIVLLLPLVAGSLLGQRQPLVRLLRERNEYLERAQELTAGRARAAERTNIAGEMHDMLGHRLSLLSLHAGALELSSASAEPKVSEQAQFLRTTAGEALTELRQILQVLHSGADDPHEPLNERTGCRSDIERLVGECAAAGMDVELRWCGTDLEQANARSRYAVHRIVREGLTNARKHAPGASATVAVTGGDRILVRITNGPGPTASKPAHGLRSGLAGLEERAEMLGGHLSGTRAPGGGFELTAELPAQLAVVNVTPQQVPPEPTADLDARALTLPRVFGAGCLLLVVLVLMLALLGTLLTVALFR